MATLDDKLLGEKTHYFCSSSEDEKEDDDGDDRRELEQKPEATAAPPPPMDLNWKGSAINTGPKGVISDFQRWKQLEAEKKEESDKERLALAKKLSMVCRTVAEEEEVKKREKQLEDEMEELLHNSEDVMKEFIKKRMEEMMEKAIPQKTFGRLIRCIDGKQFLDAIENESTNVRVICLIYSLRMKISRSIIDIFEQLAQRHPDTKFASIEVSSAGMSSHFEEKGCPTILIYKNNGTLIGNFVRVCDSLGSSPFDAEDVEQFLIEHGFLTDSSCVPTIISSATTTTSKFRDSEAQQIDSSDEN